MQPQKEAGEKSLSLNFQCEKSQQEKKKKQDKSRAWCFPYDSEPVSNSSFSTGSKNPSIQDVLHSFP